MKIEPCLCGDPECPKCFPQVKEEPPPDPDAGVRRLPRKGRRQNVLDALRESHSSLSYISGELDHYSRKDREMFNALLYLNSALQFLIQELTSKLDTPPPSDVDTGMSKEN